MRSKTIILILLAAVLISCSPVHVRMFPGAHRFPPTSPQYVDLLRREPPRPHIAFAEIVGIIPAEGSAAARSSGSSAIGQLVSAPTP